MARKPTKKPTKKLTAKAVAKEYEKSPRTVRKWCEDGLFPNAALEETPFGSGWLIPESDLASFTPPAMGNPNLLKKKKR